MLLIISTESSNATTSYAAATANSNTNTNTHVITAIVIYTIFWYMICLLFSILHHITDFSEAVDNYFLHCVKRNVLAFFTKVYSCFNISLASTWKIKNFLFIDVTELNVLAEIWFSSHCFIVANVQAFVTISKL